MSKLSQRQQMILSQIEQTLEQLLPMEQTRYQVLLESMRYSLLDGGKRIRPLLTAEFCVLCGGTVEQALPFGGALEMIHTYSLIHDDLPALEKEDLRIYLQILDDAVEEWRAWNGEKRHNLEVVFSADSKELITELS